jgi:hypothetical protein
MKKIALIVGIITFLSITQSCKNDSQKVMTEVKKDTVIQYEFEKSYTLSGTVQLIPNASETEMKSYILTLDKPINIASKSPDYQNQEAVQEILLSFEDEKMDLEKYLEKKITISGTLTASQSMHDKRPVGIFNAILK